MRKRAWEGIPQIVAITRVSKDGKLGLEKAAREQIGLQKGQALYLDAQDEVLLTTQMGEGQEIPVDGRNHICLPEKVRAELGLGKGALVGLVQRPNAVGVKAVEIAEVEALQTRLVDIETDRKIVRLVETTPLPGKLLPKLVEQYRDLALRYDVVPFLQGRQTLAAWRARQLVDQPDPSDEQRRKQLIEERLAGQGEDGSWGGQVIGTARMLRELADLGMTRAAEAIQRGVEWLLDRPQSAYNPGMFFAADELVEEQAQTIAKRGRFRQLKTSEKKRVMGGDDLIQMPCGPRIMWPNALVLETLLYLGYEGHERVQTALRFMTIHDWCECGYQHGAHRWKRPMPMSMDQIGAFERQCKHQYRYGGLRSLDELAKADMSRPTFQYPRIAHTATARGDEYTLQMQTHTQGCEFITTRAMSRVQDARMRRFAEAHLWRFASRQLAPDGAFAEEGYGTGFDQAGILEALARYDHPASKVVVMRALPWVVEAQNEDGSWGEEPAKDVSTLAVLRALDCVRAYLPSRIAVSMRAR
jgi:hypothetical protein